MNLGRFLFSCLAVFVFVFFAPPGAEAQVVEQDSVDEFWTIVTNGFSELVPQKANQTFGFGLQQYPEYIRATAWYNTKDTGSVNFEFARARVVDISKENYKDIANNWIGFAENLVVEIHKLIDQGIAMYPEDFLELSEEEIMAVDNLLSYGTSIFPSFQTKLINANSKFVSIYQEYAMKSGVRTVFFTVGVFDKNDLLNLYMFHSISLSQLVAMKSEEIFAFAENVLERAAEYLKKL